MGWPKGRKRRTNIVARNSVDGNEGAIGEDRGDVADLVAPAEGTEFIDPAGIAVDQSSGAGTGEIRTRKKRGPNKKKTNTASVNVHGLEMLLLSVHNMGAAFLKVEELQMDEAEAKTVAASIAEVAKHYDAIPEVAEKTMAWINLATVLGMSYGGRVMAYRMRAANEARGL